MDLESILQPVSEDSPTGEDLRIAMADTTFPELDELAKSVSADEDVTGGDGKDSDWIGVERLATEALGRSKDLQLAAWVTLARVHQHGFEALTEGLDLMTRGGGLLVTTESTSTFQPHAARTLVTALVEGTVGLTARLFLGEAVFRLGYAYAPAPEGSGLSGNLWGLTAMVGYRAYLL